MKITEEQKLIIRIGELESNIEILGEIADVCTYSMLKRKCDYCRVGCSHYSSKPSSIPEKNQD